MSLDKLIADMPVSRRVDVANALDGLMPAEIETYCPDCDREINATQDLVASTAAAFLERVIDALKDL